MSHAVLTGPITGTVTLPDGTVVPRIPGFARWMWDGEFCGSINARWQHGTTALPPTCLGHIGYSVVPWKQRRGYATRALALLLDELRLDTDLPFVEITTDPDNVRAAQLREVLAALLTPRIEGAVEELSDDAPELDIAA